MKTLDFFAGFGSFRRKATHGMGITDSLIGLACMGVLASLALPCLIQMRNESRLETCKEKMTTIGVAAHRYHDARRRLPAANIGLELAVDVEVWNEDEESEQYWKNQQYTSSLMQTASYMDSEELLGLYNRVPPIAMDLYSEFGDFVYADGSQVFEWQGAIDDIQEVMLAQVSEYLCPEDDLGEQDLPAIIAVQPCLPFESALDGSGDQCRDIAIQLWPEALEEGKKIGYSNYVGCLGATGLAWKSGGEFSNWLGALSMRNKVTLESIEDGTSRTVMYGESLGGISEGERRNAMSWLWGGAARMTGDVSFGEDHIPKLMNAGLLGNAEHSSSVGFGSKHDDVVVFVMCDGSCHEIRTDTDQKVLNQLAGAFDGAIPDGF